MTFSRYLGLDIMDWYGLPVRITRRNVAVEQRTEGDVTTHVWHTPKGDLREVIRVCREDNGAVSSNWTEHLVKGPEDLPAFAAIFEDEVIEPDPDGDRADAASAGSSSATTACCWGPWTARRWA